MKRREPRTRSSISPGNNNNNNWLAIKIMITEEKMIKTGRKKSKKNIIIFLYIICTSQVHTRVHRIQNMESLMRKTRITWVMLFHIQNENIRRRHWTRVFEAKKKKNLCVNQLGSVWVISFYFFITNAIHIL